MNPLLIGLIALVALIVLMLLRVPIGISMFIVGAGGLLLTKGTVLANYALATTPVSAISSFTLVAIPMFILMGNLANEAGITTELYDTGYKLLGPASRRAWHGYGVRLRGLCRHHRFLRGHGGRHDPHRTAGDGPLWV